MLHEQHYYLSHFWRQLANSVFIAAATGALTLFVATAAAFAISRLKVRGGRMVMNLALFTYFIPAAFLAVPSVPHDEHLRLAQQPMGPDPRHDHPAPPYAIWVLKQASDKLPYELDEAAYIDGASPLQLFRLIYLPLMAPSLVAIGIYAVLLAWNEYLYAFLLLSGDTNVTLSVGLGNFLAADDFPLGAPDDDGPSLRLAAGRDLLRVQALYGGRPHGRRGQELSGERSGGRGLSETD